jgi:hypothetical protein
VGRISLRPGLFRSDSWAPQGPDARADLSDAPSVQRSRYGKGDDRRPEPEKHPVEAAPPLPGLATIALLKARFDERVDHIDIFLPLVLDCVGSLGEDTFTTAAVEAALRTRHRLLLPASTTKTILERAVKRKHLGRAHGRYMRSADFTPADVISPQKDQILAGYNRLAEALRSLSVERGRDLGSPEAALRLLLQFLEENHVALLLEDTAWTAPNMSVQEVHLVADFCQRAANDRTEMAGLLKSLIEGLVLCNAAFHRNIGEKQREFKHLEVYLDSHIVRQALGFEGPDQERFARDTISLLHNAKAYCRVFDQTVDEIRRILAVHQRKLLTPAGKATLMPSEMSRHFMKFRASDIAEFIALLETDIGRLGIQIVAIPSHNPAFTLDEKALQVALADPKTGDDSSHRVLHDVDCVAAVLTLRKGRESTSLDSCKAVFATTSGGVLGSIREWYAKQGGQGIGPAVHLRGLANVAWLRCPHLVGDLKLHELVALSAAALRPSDVVWKKFKDHLGALVRSGRLTSVEELAIVAEKLTETLLASADDGGEETDAATFSEIIERVKAAHQEDARVEIAAGQSAARNAIAATDARTNESLRLAAMETAEANKSALHARERLSAAKDAVAQKAQQWATRITWALFIPLGILVFAGAASVLLSHEFHPGRWGIVLMVAVGVFLFLELVGVLDHLTKARKRLEKTIAEALRKYLWPGSPDERQPLSK